MLFGVCKLHCSTTDTGLNRTTDIRNNNALNHKMHKTKVTVRNGHVIFEKGLPAYFSCPKLSSQMGIYLGPSKFNLSPFLSRYTWNI